MSTIDEKDVLRREEVDFRTVVARFKRGWPVIALFLIFWLGFGMFFQVVFPPLFTAKTTVIFQKPKGTNDPSVIVNQQSALVRTDDVYYTNQKVAFRSYPLIEQAVKKVGLITYFKSGLLNQDIYKLSPFVVELDSTYMTFNDFETPYEEDFYVDFTNFDSYHVEIEGEYPVTEAEYYFEGDFRFGEWVTFDRTRFRLLPADTVANPKITLVNDVFEDGFGFKLLDLHETVLDYINDMEVLAEEMESTAFGVTVMRSAPEKQVDFLNALGEAYLKDHMAVKTNALKLAIKYLDQEIDETAKRLSRSEQEIQTFKSDRSITSLNQEGALLLEQTMQLESDKVNYVVKGKYYDYLENILENENDYSGVISPEAFGIKDALLIKLTEELVSLQRDLNALKQQNATANPAYSDIQSRIAANKSTILNSIKGFKESNQVMLANIDRRIREMDQSSKNIPKAERELLELERFFNLNENLYINLMDKKSDAEISLVSTAPDFRIIEHGYVTSTDPVVPFLPITLAVAIVLGVMFGLGYLLFIWIFSNRLDSVRDALHFVPHVPVAGEVYHNNITTADDVENFPHSQTVNQLSNIRYNINRRHPNAKVWAVCSLSKSEGKTFFTTLMGAQTARAGQRTLLIDGDLKNPELKKRFQTGLGPNLLEVVRGHATANEALVPTGKTGLDLAEIGIHPHLTDSELIALRNLIGDLAENYDRVIVDTTPFANDPNTLTLLEAADVLVVLARRKKTTYGNLEELDKVFSGQLFAEAELVVLDTFSQDVSFFEIFKKRKKHGEKKLGFMGRIKRALLEV